MKRKISIALCLFLTAAPLLGSFFDDNIVGNYVGNLTPYIHLTIPQLDGMPFGEAFAALFAIIIFISGAFGLIIFAATKFKNTIALKAFLAATIIYCGLRGIIGLFANLFLPEPIDAKSMTMLVVAISFDIAWIYFCYWAAHNIDRPSSKPINS
jgi:hypothetical protein